MNKCLLLLLLALTLGCGANAQNNKNKQYAVYGVAFYNLENLFDTIPNNPLGRDVEFTPDGPRKWDGNKYWHKIDNLARAIAAMTTPTTPQGPAVIGVSEIENRSVLDDLVRAEPLRKSMLQVVHHDSPDRRGVDVGLLYNPRMFKVLDVANHTLFVDGKPEFRTRDQMVVTGLLGGDTISFIVNHWPSRLGGQQQSSFLREAAAALTKHIADSLWSLRPGQGIVVMGDLNDDPMDISVSRVLGAQKKAKDVEPHGFYNPWWEMLDRGIGTLAYKGQWNLFDQIIVSGTLLEQNRPSPRRASYWKAQVNNFDFLKDPDGKRQGYPLRTFSAGVWLNGFSDHFPTEIFLKKER